jgi:hypothetical protein
MKNVISIGTGRAVKPVPDSEVTEIAIGEYVARRRMFSDGPSYLTIIGPDGSTLFVSRDVQDVVLPTLISAFEAGRERGLAQGFTRGRADLRMSITRMLAWRT